MHVFLYSLCFIVYVKNIYNKCNCVYLCENYDNLFQLTCPLVTFWKMELFWYSQSVVSQTTIYVLTVFCIGHNWWERIWRYSWKWRRKSKSNIFHTLQTHFVSVNTKNKLQSLLQFIQEMCPLTWLHTLLVMSRDPQPDLFSDNREPQDLLAH